jgi:hypothetical protein
VALHGDSPWPPPANCSSNHHGLFADCRLLLEHMFSNLILRTCTFHAGLRITSVMGSLVAFGLGQIRLYGIAVTTGRTVSRSMKGQIRPGTGRLNRSVCRSGDPSHMYQVPCAGESHRGQRVGEASSIVKHGESIIYTKPRGLHDDVWGGYGVFSFSHFFFCISSKRPLMTIHLEIPRSTPRHA